MVFILVFIVFMVLLSHLQDANIPDDSMQVMDEGSGQETGYGWGEWTGKWLGNYGLAPKVHESQSDIDNDAEVYKEPSESCIKPTESADKEPYKEPQDTTIYNLWHRLL